MFHVRRPPQRVNQSEVMFTPSTQLSDLSEATPENAILINILNLVKKHFSLDISASIKDASPDKINFIFFTSRMPFDNINKLNLKVLDFLNKFSPIISFEKQTSAFWMNMIVTVPCWKLEAIQEKLVELPTDKKLVVPALDCGTPMRAKL